MSDTIRVIRAELFKLGRRPAVWVLLATAALLNQIFAYLVPYLSYRGGGSDMMDGASPDQMLNATLPGQLVSNTLGGFPVFAGALALVLGALVFGGEYGWGTIKTQLTQGPSRLTVLAGQAGALAAAIVIGVAILFTLGAATSAGIAVAENRPLDWPSLSGVSQGLGAGALIMIMWAALGAVLGVVLKSVALPIGLGVVWVLGIENLLSAMAGSVLSGLEPLRDVLPGVNAGSLVASIIPPSFLEAPPGVNAGVDGVRALVTLLAYVVVFGAVMLWSTRRRDVL